MQTLYLKLEDWYVKVSMDTNGIKHSAMVPVDNVEITCEEITVETLQELMKKARESAIRNFMNGKGVIPITTTIVEEIK